MRNEDYYEFFLGGEGANGAEPIFEGELTPSNQRKFTLIDPGAAYRTTYSYFIEVEGDAPVGPVPLRHVDPEVYWSADRLWAEMEKLGDRATHTPRVTLDQAGTTGGGRAIPRLRIGDHGPRLALVGLIHPGEAGPELIVPALGLLLSRDPALFQHVQVVAIPAVNLDGRVLQSQGTPWYIRRTPTGTDLNRNFPAGWEEAAFGYGLDNRDPDAETYRGAAPASTAETRAVMATLDEMPPDVLLSYHALSSLCSLPALAPSVAADDAPYRQHCERCIEAFSAGAFPEQKFNPRWLKAKASTGSLPMWVYQRFHAPAFDLEMGGPDPDEVKIARTDMTHPALLRQYQQRHADALHKVLQFLASKSA